MKTQQKFNYRLSLRIMQSISVLVVRHAYPVSNRRGDRIVRTGKNTVSLLNCYTGISVNYKRPNIIFVRKNQNKQNRKLQNHVTYYHEYKKLSHRYAYLNNTRVAREPILLKFKC